MGNRDSAEVWRPAEIVLQSDEQYENPYCDVNVMGTFEHESGERHRIPGFWSGADEWRVRFAPPKTGTWEWSVSSDNDDGGFERTGVLDVSRSSGDSSIHTHGFLRVDDDNRRWFVHDDGKPFFWLADTAWAAGAKATQTEWRQYVEYRAEQGFNVVQLNSLPQFDGGEPQNRMPFGTEWNVDRPDPTYFDTLDLLVEIAVENGIFPAFIVLWFNYVQGANKTRGSYTDYRHPFTMEQAEQYARFLAARYGAYGAIWLLSGDTKFEAENELAIYRTVATAIGESVSHPLRAFHPTTNQVTPALANDEGWIEFHTYQSGHHWAEHTEYEPAMTHRALEPPRPVLNCEPRYEDMAGPDNSVRFDRAAVRRAAWTSVLAGADAGITYGAHGVWPWYRRGERFWAAYGWGIPRPWESALELPGAQDYSTMKTFLAGFGGNSLEPDQSVLIGHDDSVRAAMIGDDVLLIYSPVQQSIRLDRSAIDGNVRDLRWVDPITSRRAYAGVRQEDDRIIVKPAPWSRDGTLVCHIY